MRDGMAVTRSRRDVTLDPGSLFIYLRDVWSGDVWSATYQPTAAEPDDYLVTFRPDRATIRRRDGTIVSQLDITVSTEDDVEVRRLAITNQGPRIRELDVTSYVEIALAAPAADLAHPAFGKLFLETEYAPASSALLCRRRPRDPGEDAGLGRARPESGRPDAGPHRVGNGPGAVPRPRARRPGSRGARRPQVVGHDRRRARPHPESAPADPTRARRHRAAVARDRRRRRSRRRARARAASTGTPVPPCARSPWHSGTPRARCITWPSPATMRCSSSGWRRACSVSTDRSARLEKCSQRTISVSPDSGGTASRAICRSCSSTSSAPTRCRSSGRSCRRRSTGA